MEVAMEGAMDHMVVMDLPMDQATVVDMVIIMVDLE